MQQPLGLATAPRDSRPFGVLFTLSEATIDVSGVSEMTPGLLAFVSAPIGPGLLNGNFDQRYALLSLIQQEGPKKPDQKTLDELKKAIQAFADTWKKFQDMENEKPKPPFADRSKARDEAIKAGDKAAQEAAKAYGLDGHFATDRTGTPTLGFDPNLDQTEEHGETRGHTVGLSAPMYGRSPGFLAACIYHELVHAEQNSPDGWRGRASTTKANYDIKRGKDLEGLTDREIQLNAARDAAKELEAYDKTLEFAKAIGLEGDELKFWQEARDKAYDQFKNAAPAAGERYDKETTDKKPHTYTVNDGDLPKKEEKKQEEDKRQFVIPPGGMEQAVLALQRIGAPPTAAGAVPTDYLATLVQRAAPLIAHIPLPVWPPSFAQQPQREAPGALGPVPGILK